MTPDMADAHETARARDARPPKWTPTPGTICPRCGGNLVTGKPAPSCATDGREAHDVWCAEENYADDPCATCNPRRTTHDLPPRPGERHDRQL